MRHGRPIIFLDHQGVMYTRVHPRPGTLDDFNPECVAALNEILTKTGAHIVISSDWKRWVDLPTMQEFYKKQGIICGPIAYTPRCSPVGAAGNPAKHRADEILKYVKNINCHWVAIDDLNLVPFLGNYHAIVVRNNDFPAVVATTISLLLERFPTIVA